MSAASRPQKSEKRHFSLNGTTHAGVPQFVILQRLCLLSLSRLSSPCDKKYHKCGLRTLWHREKRIAIQSANEQESFNFDWHTDCLSNGLPEQRASTANMLQRNWEDVRHRFFRADGRENHSRGAIAPDAFHHRLGNVFLERVMLCPITRY